MLVGLHSILKVAPRISRHRFLPWGGAFYMEKKQMDYKSKRWKLRREAILRRDTYRCIYCKRYGKFKEANTVHHIMPAEFFPEYSFTNWNLISLCTVCHNSMHDRDTHKLTKKGWGLLLSTARKNSVEIPEDMQKKLVA